MYVYVFLLLAFKFIFCDESCLELRRKYYARYHSPEPEPCPDLVQEEESNHILENICDRTQMHAKLVVNPYKSLKNNFVGRKEFASGCLKCVACLAVAEEINKTIQTLEINFESDPQITEKNINQTLTELCTKGFQNFDLREYNGYGLITRSSEHTKHVPSPLDGEWTRKLRCICGTYVNNLNIFHFYNELLSKNYNFLDSFCRGSGVFRDCKNIDYGPVMIPEETKNFILRLRIACGSDYL